MEKEGKIDLYSVLFASIIILVVYAVFVGGVVPLDFPINKTNASAIAGIGDTSAPSMGAFNGTSATFKCNITSMNTTTLNVTNVSLFINSSPINLPFDISNTTSVRNQTINTSISSVTPNTVIFNVTTSFNEGTYAWWCESEDNATTITYNQSGTNYFTIDRTVPSSKSLTVTKNSAVSTGDVIYLYANLTDDLTAVHTARLFVNTSGTANNQVNITGSTNGVSANNLTAVNLSFKIPGSSLGEVLNFTFQVNDSVNNINITVATIITVAVDATPPGPINLSGPINLFNRSTTGALEFNFSAADNNASDTNFLCDINVSKEGVIFESIAGISVTNGAVQLSSSTTAFTNGSYSWSVNCTDGANNVNTSRARTFTIDNIPPVFGFYNITTDAKLDPDAGSDTTPEIGQNDRGSVDQGNTIYAVVNWTDNLTQPLQAALQFFNVSSGASGSWQTINESPSDYLAYKNESWTNLSFRIPIGRNEFEGRNVSFRVVGNDTLGNRNISNSVKNFTTQINDTFPPTITINGTIAVNNTVTSNTRPLISWAVQENNLLKSINISVDGILPTTGIDGCSKSAFFSSSLSGEDNVETGSTVSGGSGGVRNGSFQISTGGCVLGNGPHSIQVVAIDVWGNSLTEFHNFSVQSGTQPGLQFINLTNLARTGLHSVAAVNNSNITSFVGLSFSGTDGVGAGISNLTYKSSCNTTGTIIFSNATTIYPFNTTSEVACATTSASRTLTITVNDTAGNTNSTVFGFLVDNVGPPLTVTAPLPGFSGANNITINLSAQDDSQKISTFGYYLDGSDFFNNLNNTPGVGKAGQSTRGVFSVNFTSGTHTIKFTVNDTLGNVVNSSVRTITVLGPINFGSLNLNTTLRGYNVNISFVNLTNASGGAVIDVTRTVTDQTLNLFMALNGTVKGINVTINFNASAANWDRYNFSVRQNDSILRHLANNQTATILDFILFNRSIQDFISNNNSYFGKITLPLNVTGFGGEKELWYFANEDDLSAKTNITQCAIGLTVTHSLTSGLPCWNNTNNATVDIYVPHFSVVAAVNNSDAPTVNVTAPIGNQTVSMFVPNITVSADAVSCKFIVNGSTANESMVKNGNICLGSTQRFKNR